MESGPNCFYHAGGHVYVFMTDVQVKSGSNILIRVKSINTKFCACSMKRNSIVHCQESLITTTSSHD